MRLARPRARRLGKGSRAEPREVAAPRATTVAHAMVKPGRLHRVLASGACRQVDWQGRHHGRSRTQSNDGRAGVQSARESGAVRTGWTMSTTDAVLQRFRDLSLSLPETSEVGSWGHPNFRAGKRTFATFEWIKGRPSVAIRLGAEDVELLLLRHKQFFVTPYGKGQWVSVWADGPMNWQLVEELVERSYRLVALKRMIAALDGTQAQQRTDNAS